MRSKSVSAGSVAASTMPALQASTRGPARNVNVNVAALNKRVNESARFTLDAVHKTFVKAMTQAKAKAKP